MEIQDSHTTKLTKIGNSQTLRIPKRFVEKYFPDGEVLIEATDEGLYISKIGEKLTYKKAAIEMVKEKEDWKDWNVFQDSGVRSLGDW
jgi:virulence-associated protein VagC